MIIVPNIWDGKNFLWNTQPSRLQKHSMLQLLMDDHSHHRCHCWIGNHSLSFLLPVIDSALSSCRLCCTPLDASFGGTSWTTPLVVGTLSGTLQVPVLPIQSQILTLSSPDFSSIGTCQDPTSDSCKKYCISNRKYRALEK